MTGDDVTAGVMTKAGSPGDDVGVITRHATCLSGRAAKQNQRAQLTMWEDVTMSMVWYVFDAAWSMVPFPGG